MKKSRNKTISLILHNIRSAHNVGSVFRTADGAGVAKIYLTGYTPTPVDRFGRKRKDFAKVSLGAERTVSWERVNNAESVLRRLKEEGVLCAAIEQARDSVNYRRIPLKKHAVFLFGNEVSGLPPRLLKKCDVIAAIPMRGRKESLNVAVAVAVVLFQYAAAIE